MMSISSLTNHLLDAGADIVKIAIDSGGTFGRQMPIFSPEAAAGIEGARQVGRAQPRCRRRRHRSHGRGALPDALTDIDAIW